MKWSDLNCHRVEARNKVSHPLPLSNPTDFRQDRPNQVRELLSRVAETTALRTVRTMLQLAPLFFVKHQFAEHTGSEFLRAWRHIVTINYFALFCSVVLIPLSSLQISVLFKLVLIIALHIVRAETRRTRVRSLFSLELNQCVLARNRNFFLHLNSKLIKLLPVSE